MRRRDFMTIVGGAAGVWALPAWAQDSYPSHSVTLVVPFAPGGAIDTFTRVPGQKLSARLSQSFVVENRPGAGTVTATAAPERSASLPNVPTTKELGYPEMIASNTYSLFGPPKMAPDIVAKLNALVLKELRSLEVQAAFATQAATPAGASPAEFTKQIHSEAGRWLPIIKATGIKAD